MARIAPLSGFPEWLPEGRIVEQRVLDTLRKTFELHGFASVETRAVEPLDQLLRKGETSKEVYVLSRLQELKDAPRGEASVSHALAPEVSTGSTSLVASAKKQLGLHFDLTVPFARYVLENAGKLHFPFKRYQIQKVWRGERPQDGRFREFTQADIDIVGAGELPFHYEIEAPLVIADAFAALAPLGVPGVRISVNNRKVCEGFYRALGIADVEGVLRNIDKLAKIGPEKVRGALLDEGIVENATQADQCLRLAGVTGAESNVAAIETVREIAASLGIESDLLAEGLKELDDLATAAEARAPGVVVVDLSIARGLDYYTGTVYETTLLGHEDLGSVCSGGRYDALASDGKNTYPGVGLSIGVSRLVSRLLSGGLVAASRSVPTAVLVAVNDEADRAASNAVAATLRANGIPTDVAPKAAKFGKQIQYADRRGIPYVWFPGTVADDGTRAPDQVKDIRTGEQSNADAKAWTPPTDDLEPLVEAAG